MISLHIYFGVKPGLEAAFEGLYRESYVPAISVQQGFRSTTLLRSFDPGRSAAIEASSDWSHEIDIVFDTEEQRQSWAAGPEHSVVWPKVVAMCDLVRWQGFDIRA